MLSQHSLWRPSDSSNIEVTFTVTKVGLSGNNDPEAKGSITELYLSEKLYGLRSANLPDPKNS